MNERGVVLTVGILLILVGLIGIATNSSEDTQQTIPSPNGSSSLRVEEASQKPQSTIDQIQGSGGLQNQGSAVQNQNAGSSLQPNAGATSLPAGY